MPLPIVAIVGLPNVGKSTLFNRIIHKKQAIVEATPGVTRDRHYAEAVWEGVHFNLVDTGGYLPPGEGDEFMDAVREQTMIAADEADLIIMMTDAMAGLSDGDQMLVKMILQRKRPILLAANKIDDPTRVGLAWDLSLGLNNPYPISALNGFQVADLLDGVATELKKLKPVAPSRPDPTELALAIIGAPNAGKSSLVNKLCGEERMIVSDIPGTTRDSVDTIIKYHGKSVRLIDTAGLKRKHFGQSGLEFYSMLRSIKALQRCDVAVVLVDGTIGMSQGNIKLINQAAKEGVGVIIGINKWDLIEKDHKTADEWLEKWWWKAPSLKWAPVFFISALTGQRSIRVVEEAFIIKEERVRHIPTTELNDTIISLLSRTPPPQIKGKNLRIKYMAQVETAPPKFALFSRYADLIPDSYLKFTERLIRENFGFKGVPIRIAFRKK